MGPSTLQQNTSISRVFVLGAPIPAMLLATWCVRPSVDDGRGGQPYHRGKRALTLVTFTLAFFFGHRFSPLMFAQILKCRAHQRVADHF